MTVIDVEIGTGSVKALPVPVTVTDKTLLTGTAQLCGWSLRDASGDAPAESEGQLVSPGAFGQINGTVALAAGTYDVSWTVALQGAAAAADANNFTLNTSSVQVVQSINAGAAGSYPQVPARVTITQGQVFKVLALNAGTVGVTYLAQLEAVPVLVPNAVAEIQDGGNILGEVAVPGNAASTVWFDRDGIDVQGQIKLHLVSGTLTGVVYAKFDGGSYTP